MSLTSDVAEFNPEVLNWESLDFLQDFHVSKYNLRPRSGGVQAAYYSAGGVDADVTGTFVPSTESDDDASSEGEQAPKRRVEKTSEGKTSEIKALKEFEKPLLAKNIPFEGRTESIERQVGEIDDEDEEAYSDGATCYEETSDEDLGYGGEEHSDATISDEEMMEIVTSSRRRQIQDEKSDSSALKTKNLTKQEARPFVAGEGGYYSRPASKEEAAARREDMKKKREGEQLTRPKNSVPERPVNKDGVVGRTTIIRTSYAHPILFYRAPYQDTCSWCERSWYGLFGLGTKYAEVVEWGLGEPYDEISGGHKADGHVGSMMCDDCTFDRIKTIACSRHDLVKIEGRDPRTFDYKYAYDSLRLGAELWCENILWCSLCVSPAFWKCKTKTHESKFRPHGCALMVCEECREVLTKSFNSDLQKLLRVCFRNPRTKQKHFPHGMRADASFLRRNKHGELHRQLGC